MVRVLHISKNLAHLVATIGTFNVVGKSFSMAANLTDEGVSGSLENQTYAEVGVIFLFFQACFRQFCLESNIALLLKSQFFTHCFKNTDFADY